METKKIGYVNVQILKEHVPPVRLVNLKKDPKEYFQNRSGLYVSEAFKREISSKATVTENSVQVHPFDLIETSADKLIELALPEEHVFTVDAVCEAVVALIETQSDGKEGLLVTTGAWNLFYTPSFVVSVDRLGGKWCVHAWERGDFTWGAGFRVFSPATEISKS